MKRIAGISILVLLVAPIPAAAQQPHPEFPTKEQITLLLVQAERAFDTYEHAVTLEAGLWEQTALGKETVVKDRKVLNNAREIIRALKQNPDGFNTPAGFLLVGGLDDASRNAALCAGSVYAEAATDMMVGRAASAEVKMTLGEACTGASALLYTVSETAVNMYSESLLATDDMLKQSFNAATQCSEALKLLQSKQPARKP